MNFLKSLSEWAARLTTTAIIAMLMCGGAATAEEHGHEDLRAEIEGIDAFMRQFADVQHEANSLGTETLSSHQKHLSLLGEALDMLTDRIERLEAEVDRLEAAERGQ